MSSLEEQFKPKIRLILILSPQFTCSEESRKLICAIIDAQDRHLTSSGSTGVHCTPMCVSGIALNSETDLFLIDENHPEVSSLSLQILQSVPHVPQED